MVEKFFLADFSWPAFHAKLLFCVLILVIRKCNPYSRGVIFLLQFFVVFFLYKNEYGVSEEKKTKTGEVYSGPRKSKNPHWTFLKSENIKNFLWIGLFIRVLHRLKSNQSLSWSYELHEWFKEQKNHITSLKYNM